MRNLVNFLWRHNFTILFLFLEFIAFIFLVQTNRFHKANFISRTNAVSGNVYSALNNMTEYLELKRVNEEIAAENAQLKGNEDMSYIKLRGPHVYIEDSLYFQQYKYLSAKVVNNSVHKRNNYVIINQGSEQGIEPGMGVICPNGLVGKVKDVSEHYSSVVSVLHSKTQISVKLKKNNYFGILTWSATDNALSATVKDIPNHVQLNEGDTLISMGASAVFPEGILAGTVKSFENIEGSDFYDVKINLSTNFQNLSYVYVIINLLKKEQLELQQKAEKSDG